MTKTRRTILLLTQIFMVLAGVLAFRNFATITSHLPELSRLSPVPDLEKGSTPEARRLNVMVCETQMSLTLVASALKVSSGGIFLYGALLLGGSLIHFFLTPWKLGQPPKS